MTLPLVITSEECSDESRLNKTLLDFCHSERGVCDPPGALLIRAQKHVECGGMTQESCDIFGVVAAVQHALPGPGQAYQPSSNVQIFEEKSLNVVGLHGSKV